MAMHGETLISAESAESSYKQTPPNVEKIHTNPHFCVLNVCFMAELMCKWEAYRERERGAVVKLVSLRKPLSHCNVRLCDRLGLSLHGRQQQFSIEKRI